MGIKYASKYRQTVAVDVGQLPTGGKVGTTIGERRDLAKAPRPEAPSTKSAFQRVKDFLGFSADTLPAANAQFIHGSTHHPFNRLGQGKPVNVGLYDDRKLMAILNVISPKKPKGPTTA